MIELKNSDESVNLARAILSSQKGNWKDKWEGMKQPHWPGIQHRFLETDYCSRAAEGNVSALC